MCIQRTIAGYFAVVILSEARYLLRFAKKAGCGGYNRGYMDSSMLG
jgi:hypothetical protein